jgi:hypothetical protein
MITQIRILFGSILLLTAAMASAQIAPRVAVTVPFSFAAGSQTMPAGDYIIELNPEKQTMLLRWAGSSRHVNPVLMLASNSEQPANSYRTYTIFQRYGANYFLAQVWSQGTGQTITPGKLERELAKRSTGETREVEARLSPR